MFCVDDFNMCEINDNGHFVRIEELNKMIAMGAIVINREKLNKYKVNTSKGGVDNV